MSTPAIDGHKDRAAFTLIRNACATQLASARLRGNCIFVFATMCDDETLSATPILFSASELATVAGGSLYDDKFFRDTVMKRMDPTTHFAVYIQRASGLAFTGLLAYGDDTREDDAVRETISKSAAHAAAAGTTRTVEQSTEEMTTAIEQLRRQVHRMRNMLVSFQEMVLRCESNPRARNTDLHRQVVATRDSTQLVVDAQMKQLEVSNSMLDAARGLLFVAQ